MRLFAVIISAILGVVQTLLGLRIVFAFLGLPSVSGVVGSVNTWSAPLAHPFMGLLPQYRFGNFVLDSPAIIALLVYAFISAFFIRVIRAGH